MQLDSRSLHHLKIAAIGEITAAELQKQGIIADVTPKQYEAESLVYALKEACDPGTRVLLPRAKDAREVLPQSLAVLDIKVDIIPVYETRPVKHKTTDWRWLGNIDIITFTSSSTVTMLQKSLPPETFATLIQKAVAACIGPVTAKTAQTVGFANTIIASQYTAQDLCQAILNYIEKRTV